MCGILAIAIVEVKISSSHYIHEAREEFISVSIGCLHIIHHRRNLNFANPRVVAVLSGLSPIYAGSAHFANHILSIPK